MGLPAAQPRQGIAESGQDCCAGGRNCYRKDRDRRLSSSYTATTRLLLRSSRILQDVGYTRDTELQTGIWRWVGGELSFDRLIQSIMEDYRLTLYCINSSLLSLIGIHDYYLESFHRISVLGQLSLLKCSYSSATGVYLVIESRALYILEH